MREIKVNVHTGRGQNDLRIEVSDCASNLKICEIIIPTKDIGEAIFGSGAKVKAFLIESLDNVDKKREIKRENVWIPLKPYIALSEKDSEQGIKYRKMIEEQLKPLEINGWKGNPGDVYNSRNFRQDVPPPTGASSNNEYGVGWYEVVFTRFVKRKKL